MSEDSIGTRMGDYEILGVLGAGGMGKVYKVRNVLSDRIEAMKVLLPNLADQKQLAERFLREIKVLASFNHPNIAALRTALTIDNQLVMIMEYVEGTTLAARLGHGAIPCGEAVGYIAQVLSALSYAHKHQVIHRDIKPANMMLTPNGTIKLTDFGIARSNVELGMTTVGTTLGSIAYMSPEQVRCEPADARSDLYSVGISFYEMVTGQRPFQSDSNFSMMQAHLREVPKLPLEVKPDLLPGISELIMMAVEKDPAKRFQSADAFANALQGVAGNLGAARAPRFAASPTPPAPAVETAFPSGSTAPLTPAPSMFAPVAPQPQRTQAAEMPPLPASGTTHRGLYITLGALIVVVVLVAAGFSAPRWFKTRANSGAPRSPANSSSAPATPEVAKPEQSAPAPETATPEQQAPASSSVEPLAPAPAVPEAPADSSLSSTPSYPAAATKTGRHAKRPSQSETAQQPAGEAGAQAAQPDKAQLEALDQELDQLSSREIAVSASLDALSKEQNAKGMHLRGDMVEAQARMRMYLGKAQSAIQAQDAKSARKYLDLAEPEVERLEKFLGR